MKSRFKTTLLVTTLALTISAVPVIGAAKTSNAKENSTLKNADERSAYALGISFGYYINSTLQEQKTMGISLDKAQLLAGVQDAINERSKLSDKEINATLKKFQEHVKQAAEKKMREDSQSSLKKGADYRANFEKEKGVVKTKSGLLYKIEQEGKGIKPGAKDTVVVNYKGTLIDGTVFDSSYERKEPLTLALDRVIKGWTEGLQLLKKGGKIMLVIPPELAYGEVGTPGIPSNSTLVFNVELLDVKPVK